MISSSTISVPNRTPTQQSNLAKRRGTVVNPIQLSSSYSDSAINDEDLREEIHSSDDLDALFEAATCSTTTLDPYDHSTYFESRSRLDTRDFEETSEYLHQMVDFDDNTSDLAPFASHMEYCLEEVFLHPSPNRSKGFGQDRKYIAHSVQDKNLSDRRGRNRTCHSDSRTKSNSQRLKRSCSMSQVPREFSIFIHRISPKNLRKVTKQKPLSPPCCYPNIFALLLA